MRHLGVLGLLAALAGCGGLQSWGGKDARRVETEHFNCIEMQASAFDPIPHCEQIYAATSKATGLTLDERVDVGIFASRKDLKRYLDDCRFGAMWANGKVGGAAMPFFGEIAIWAGSDPVRFRGILAHELTHYLLEQVGLPSAGWKSEAISYAAGWIVPRAEVRKVEVPMEQWFAAVRENRLTHGSDETAAWTSFVTWMLETKRIQLLKDLIPVLERLDSDAGYRRELEMEYARRS